MIEFDGVSQVFGERVVLDDVTCVLAESRVGIIGSNGSGKSTLARMVNGLVTPTRGVVRTLGMDVARQAAAVRRRVGFLFSDPDAQILMPTPAQDVAFSLRGRGLSRDQVATRARETLESLGIDHLADAPAHRLSGGEKQLLALASVLVTEPDILVCDEPTTLLDLRNSRRVMDVLSGLSQQVVLVTHHLHLVEGWARVLVVDSGRIVADGSGAESVACYRRLMGEPC